MDTLRTHFRKIELENKAKSLRKFLHQVTGAEISKDSDFYQLAAILYDAKDVIKDEETLLLYWNSHSAYEEVLRRHLLDILDNNKTIKDGVNTIKKLGPTITSIYGQVLFNAYQNNKSADYLKYAAVCEHKEAKKELDRQKKKEHEAKKRKQRQEEQKTRSAWQFLIKEWNTTCESEGYPADYQKILMGKFDTWLDKNKKIQNEEACLYSNYLLAAIVACSRKEYQMIKFLESNGKKFSYSKIFGNSDNRLIYYLNKVMEYICSSNISEEMKTDFIKLCINLYPSSSRLETIIKTVADLTLPFPLLVVRDLFKKNWPDRPSTKDYQLKEYLSSFDAKLKTIDQ